MISNYHALKSFKMKRTQNKNLSRRQFIGTASTLVVGSALASPIIGAPAIIHSSNQPNSLIKGVQIGVITYSFRSMPDQSAEATLQYVLDSGVSAIELMGDPAETFAGRPKNPVDWRAFYKIRRKNRKGEELTMEEKKQMAAMRSKMDEYNAEVSAWRSKVSMKKFKKLRKMYAKAGVKIYGFKPNAFGKNNSDSDIEYGFKAAKALGASHITLEHPSDDAHTQKLGKMAAKYKIFVGYHGHEQQTPTFWDTAIQQSPYNALNLDIGHYTAAGFTDTMQLIQGKSTRMMSMHIKDRRNPTNGKENRPWGQGDTPIVDVLQLMRDKKYQFPATIELEYEIPEGSDAVKEVRNCLEYCRKALS